MSKEANGVKLTDEEILLKVQIKESGFTHFNKNDYHAIIRSFERFDPDDYDSIANYIKKDVEQVKEYVQELFNRRESLKEGERILNNINRLNSQLESRKEN